MKLSRIVSITVAASALCCPQLALAYRLELAIPPAVKRGEPCRQDGALCIVYCQNGHLAGSMTWNGSVWTDGVKWDKDRDVEAKMIVAADGTACM